MKRIGSILMTLLLMWSLVLPASAAGTSTVATLRLEKTEGTVTVANASGKSVSVTKGMRLYSGYTIATAKNSYAYISLDSDKAVKLDASSKVEVKKSGKKLELSVSSGKLFFHVTVPVAKDESLNIRTSTMVTGVRGTSGWVEVENRFTSRVHLLEGTVTVTSTEPASGQMRQATITGGQTATATLKGTSQPGSQMSLTVTAMEEKQVPGFVAVEVAKDPVLQQKIEKKSTLSVPKIIGEAQNRLSAEQKEADEAEKKLNQALSQITADKVKQVFTPPSSGGGSSYVPPAPDPDPTPDPEPDPTSITLDDPTAAELTAALTKDGVTSVTVTSANPDELSRESYTVASGQTLIIQSGTFTVGAGKTLTIETGGTLTNDSTLTNNGTLTNDGDLVNSGTLTNNGDFTCAGTYTENRNGLYAMMKNDDGGVLYLGLASALPAWNENTVVTLLGAKQGHIEKLPPITVSGVTLDLNGRTASLAASLVLDTGANLTITDSSEEGIGCLESTMDNEPTIRLDDGSLTISGGTVTGSGTAIRTNKDSAVAVNGGTVSSATGIGIDVFSGTVTVDGGTVSSESGTGIYASGYEEYEDEEQNSHFGVVRVNSGAVTSTSGSAILLADFGHAYIFGGTVEGAVYGIQNCGKETVTISGGTVILTADPKTNDDGSSQLDGYAVSGPFRFYDGALKAKGEENLIDPKYLLETVSIAGPDSEGYYTATSTLKPEL